MSRQKSRVRSGRIRASLAVSAAALLVLTACGEGSPSGAEDGETGATAEGELTPIDVGVIPIGDVASIYVGEAEGIFEEHGLDLTLTQAQGGAAIVPGVQSGDLDFGFSNVVSLVIARDQGLPIKGVATGPQTTGEPDEDFAAVMVPEGSGVESMADLEGMTVAVNTLNNINHLMLNEGVRQAGGDPSAVDVVEVAFPDMVGQLESGNVEAITAVEPFVTIGETSGFERIYGFFAEPVEDLSVSAYFTTEEKIEQEPEIVEAFTAAMKESQQFSEDNPEIVRETLPEYTTIDPEILGDLAIPRFPQEHHRGSLQEVIDAADLFDLISEPVEVEGLLTNDA